MREATSTSSSSRVVLTIPVCHIIWHIHSVEVTSHTRVAFLHRSCVCAGHGLCVGHCLGHAPTQVLSSGDNQDA